MTKKRISIGIPCFNEENNIIPAYKALKHIALTYRKYTFEFIFVDNGSTDNSKQSIMSLAKQDREVVGIFLSRNFGPEASTHAAFSQASGDSFIFFPCDLQDPPELIPEFIKKWEQGYDITLGVYTKTEDVFFMKFLRKHYYNIIKTIANINIPTNADGYGLIDRKVMNALKQLPERYRFYRGLVAWVGFKTAYITYERRSRERGKSSYKLLDYFKHAERSFFGFSYVPLDIIIYIGFSLVLLSFAGIFIFLLLHLLYGHALNISILILIAILFFGGIQLMAFSIVGKYIQVIVEETKSRPMYIIRDIINEKK